jgi:CheY-like chemotaxis protein
MGEADRPAVLVVDDEPAVRLLVTEVLADEGCEILQAETSEAGLAWLQSDRTIDLLVTDIGLPGMNGRQLADAGLLHRPGLRILFITGNAEQALLDKACLAPSMHVLSKPFAIDRLAARVRAILAAAPERG